MYWSDGHVRKTRAFQRDYPALAPCVDNRLVTPEEAASMYRRSRIGLNVHGNGHHGLSVRTFEILACGTYQLVDALPGLRDTLRVGYDLDAFENDDDLCVKIDAALADPDRCRAIASQGERTVRERFTAHRVVEDLVDVLTRSAAAARP